MAVKREEEGPTADAPSKSPMEESVDALAGVEGAFLTGGKRKAAEAAEAVAAALGSPPRKKAANPTTMNPTTTTTKGEMKGRPRSSSIDLLAEVVAGALLGGVPEAVAKDKGLDPVHVQVQAPMQVQTPSNAALAAAAAAAVAAASVPDPMADAADFAKAHGVVAPVVPAIPAVPTGFRKKVGGGGAALHAHAHAGTPPAPKPAPLLGPGEVDDGRESDGDAGDQAKKAQITYNPDIPMTKEQLTAWRREMRRVRNRESAAASRRKVRDRIEELEDEVAVWKKRYQEVLARLGQASSEDGGRGGGRRKRKAKGGADKGEEGSEGKAEDLQA